MVVTKLGWEGPTLTSQSPPSGAPYSIGGTNIRVALGHRRLGSTTGQGRPTSRCSPCRTGRKPARSPWERSLPTRGRKCHCETTQPSTEKHSRDTELISHSTGSPTEEAPQGIHRGVPNWRTPPLRQQMARQGLGSPGQSAATVAAWLGHSVPRAGASCDAFLLPPPSLVPRPEQTPQPETGQVTQQACPKPHVVRHSCCQN